LNDIKGTDGIKSKIKKLHESRLMTDEIYALRERVVNQDAPRSYRDVVTNNQRTVQPQRHNNSREPNRYQENMRNNSSIVCWTCNKAGHVSRECTMKRTVTCYGCGVQGHVKKDCPNREKRTVTCFACGIQGHVRRDCQQIRCKRCNLGGHREAECYTNLERLRNRRTFVNNRRPSGSDNYENARYHGTRNGARQSDNRYVAYMDERTYEGARQEYRDEYRDHPNANAPAQEEIVGAVY
jgi:hypothetical protein